MNCNRSEMTSALFLFVDITRGISSSFLNDEDKKYSITCMNCIFPKICLKSQPLEAVAVTSFANKAFPYIYQTKVGLFWIRLSLNPVTGVLLRNGKWHRHTWDYVMWPWKQSLECCICKQNTKGHQQLPKAREGRGLEQALPQDHQKELTMLTLGFQTYSLQNGGRIHFYCFKPLWWLISSVIWLGHEMPRHLVWQYSGCFCKGVPWVRWTFKAVDLVKQIGCPTWMASIQSGDGLNRTKRPTLPPVGRFLLSDCLELTLPEFGFKLKYQRFMCLALSSFQTGTCTLSSAGSQTFGLRLELACGFFWVCCMLPAFLGTSQPP